MCKHAVQFYEHDTFLVREAATFILANLREGAGCLVIINARLQPPLLEQLQLLEPHNWSDLAAGYHVIDTKQALAHVMVNEWPNEQQFRQFIHQQIQLIHAVTLCPMSMFGDMVAELISVGRLDAALELERLWQVVVEQDNIRLLCAYPAHIAQQYPHLYQQLCQQHSHVLVSDMNNSLAISQGVDLIKEHIPASISEEALQLAAIVYRYGHEAIMVCDANHYIMAINPAFSEITGFAEQEIMGQYAQSLFVGQTELNYSHVRTALAEQGQWLGEIWTRRKNGSQFIASANINRIEHQQQQDRYIILFSDITEKKLSEELIWKQANFDVLTELPNRRLFKDRLDQEIKKSQRIDQFFAILFIDLDNFKEINDMLGHDMGDRLLQEAARRLQDCVRESDTVARLGGDEFTILLTNLAQQAHVEDIAQKVLSRITEPFYLGHQVFYLSASIGITIYPFDAIDSKSLLKNAEQAMYVAKDDGRNRFCYFTRSMQLQAQERLKLRHDLYNALEQQQIQAYFQPIVELNTGRIIKAEALIRWRHPEKGMISPALFIPIAEESGMIKKLGDWMFYESAIRAQYWSRQLGYPFQISVNRSPAQFIADDKDSPWLDYLQQKGMSGRCIVIEITEGLLLNVSPRIKQQLDAYRQAGIQVSIDDFGTGYSSMAYLQKLQVDYLKIDQSFVREMVDNAGSRAIVEAMIVMAHKLGLKVVAEGVETLEQKRMLIASGCDYGQGYLFSPPVPPIEFERLLHIKSRLN
ncbi:putative bifunctional diguanylate cyclase/phosphodiesterase [Agitococcus lubricus]|uniref:PAS domain S-box-containing protein/diguanylate cyclase (GGDEF)-like protein n=1 Tax=Agitococcus lubricus TaxID=1077255 RepID=A0A2T5J263_9GAMM|nr:EAL domain-containing protein [Agitococcus lubricus]PTQ90604.1 PAS domain S-box-containing protein/diguanylate cyclase (GGDEF)-like protein [Agitococcus lubricus]